MEVQAPGTGDSGAQSMSSGPGLPAFLASELVSFQAHVVQGELSELTFIPSQAHAESSCVLSHLMYVTVCRVGHLVPLFSD